MLIAAIDEIGKEYNIWEKVNEMSGKSTEINCADFVANVINKGTKGRVKIDKPKNFNMSFTDPKKQYENFKQNNPGRVIKIKKEEEK